jgi:hypothetical protein
LSVNLKIGPEAIWEYFMDIRGRKEKQVNKKVLIFN